MGRTIDFLLHNACAGIRYRLRRELLGEPADSAAMTALQEEVQAQPNVQRLLARRHADGWLGKELHGGEGLDGSVDALLRAGVERTSPILQNVIPAVLHPSSDPAYRTTFRGGAALDDSGLGGDRSVKAQVLARLGAENNDLVRKELAAALSCFSEALEYCSIDDITRSDAQGRRYYLPNVRFPGANHLCLLAYTYRWRSDLNLHLLKSAFAHCTALMRDVQGTIFCKHGHLIGPFGFNWHLDAFSEERIGVPYALLWFVRYLERMAGLEILHDDLRSAYDKLWKFAESGALCERQTEASLRCLRRFAVEPSWQKPEARRCDLLFLPLPALYDAGYDVNQL